MPDNAQLKKELSFEKNFMAIFNGQLLTVLRLQNHYKEITYLYPLSSQNILVLIWLTLEGSKAGLTLEPHTGFELVTSGLWKQHPNMWTIALRDFLYLKTITAKNLRHSLMDSMIIDVENPTNWLVETSFSSTNLCIKLMRRYLSFLRN